MKTGLHYRRMAAGLTLAVASATAAPAGATSAWPPVEGRTLGEWTARWWQWAFDQGLNDGPSFQAGEIDCRFGQTGQIWFLAGIAGDTGTIGGGGTAGRTCKQPIPAHVRLFFPLVNVNLGNPDALCPFGNPGPNPGNCTVAQKRRLVDSVLSDTVPGPFNSTACQLKAELDGIPVYFGGTPILRLQSPPFFLAALPPFLLEDDPKVISDGYWVLLPRLRPGQHRLTIGGGICDEDDPANVLFGNEVTYSFRVQ